MERRTQRRAGYLERGAQRRAGHLELGLTQTDRQTDRQTEGKQVLELRGFRHGEVGVRSYHSVKELHASPQLRSRLTELPEQQAAYGLLLAQAVVLFLCTHTHTAYSLVICAWDYRSLFHPAPTEAILHTQVWPKQEEKTNLLREKHRLASIKHTYTTHIDS